MATQIAAIEALRIEANATRNAIRALHNSYHGDDIRGMRHDEQTYTELLRLHGQLTEQRNQIYDLTIAFGRDDTIDRDMRIAYIKSQMKANAKLSDKYIAGINNMVRNSQTQRYNDNGNYKHWVDSSMTTLRTRLNENRTRRATYMAIYRHI